MMNRRNLLQTFAAGAGTALAMPLNLNPLSSFKTVGLTPKRVVFFIQNQGFDPLTCIPKGMNNGGSLAKKELPEPVKALEPFKERLHIINGLHGMHTSPNHSAYFGALGGYRGGRSVAPVAETIDHALSKILPETLLPHLCIGMDSLESMRAKPTIATLSASGAGKPVFMHSNPIQLYQLLFGGVSQGRMRENHEATASVLTQIEKLAEKNGRNLTGGDERRYEQFVSGFKNVNGLRKRLEKLTDTLREHAPVVDERYENPEFETDWHDANLEIGIAALTSGITNTLTVGSGRGHVFGAWKGLGVKEQGHNLGHMSQPDNPIWIKIRQYNCRMLVKIMETLEGIPEGSGTMMDHTLIVYTSNNADRQHTSGTNWPVMLLGNLDGALKTGRVTQLDGSRPINALYTSLLRAAGSKVDRFNMSDQIAKKYDGGSGPLRELLV